MVDSRQTASASVNSASVKTKVHANPAWLALAGARSVLMLQGPLGPFFDRLAVWLKTSGTKVNRIAFQSGDEHDCKALVPIKFTAPLSHWPDFLRLQLIQLNVDCVVLFGQSRQYHNLARQIAEQLSIAVVVMEEGYFRPGFATMELGGVNGYSTTLQRFVWEQAPSAAVSEAALPAAFVGALQPHHSSKHFQKMAWHASQHYLALWHGRKHFPHYQHHKKNNPYWYAQYWVWSWMKKLACTGPDKRMQRQLVDNSRPYYFVPLQHDGDAQITHHSCFGENTEFIINVLRSFCDHAPGDSCLVFRQHPHSRGGPGHSVFINSLARELGIANRVLHLCEGDTPLLAQHSAGVVLINSTVGLQALERGAPLMVLGDALYNQPGLCFGGHVDQFWQQAHKPVFGETEHFLVQIKNLTQVPASLYAMRNEPLVWASPTSV